MASIIRKIIRITNQLVIAQWIGRITVRNRVCTLVNNRYHPTRHTFHKINRKHGLIDLTVITLEMIKIIRVRNLFEIFSQEVFAKKTLENRLFRFYSPALV